jgi:serine protease AprX
MLRKQILNIESREQIQIVRNIGCETVAEYPDALLVRSTEMQRDQLEAAGIEMRDLPGSFIKVAGPIFAFTAALDAEVAMPTTPDPDRIAYYFVQLVGPPKGEWLAEIRESGGEIQGSVSDFVLVVGVLPSHLGTIERMDWVEAVAPYRPSMKVSPKLFPVPQTGLSATDLANVEKDTDIGGAIIQVEISVFSGEDTEPIADLVRAAGAQVLSEGESSMIAVLSPLLLDDLADTPGVQAILPHRFPELFNDRAAQVMGIPENRQFGEMILTGRGQTVAVADSGLDNGDPALIHPDFKGRIADIVSFPNRFPENCHDKPPYDDGPADLYSGHGTHVAGSVLGDGLAAMSAGSSMVPKGIAPEAKLYFQAVEQKVNWFTSFWDKIGLWGLPDDLTDLFTPAYRAGARIHTNSWGASIDGQYTAWSGQVDRFMWLHRDTLLLFGAGNSGTDQDSSGRIDRDSMGVPGTAKNCLTVGACESDRPRGSNPRPGRDVNWVDLRDRQGNRRFPALEAAGHVSDNTEGMAAFSSRGPCDDGRIKPDLVAPGTNIVSTRSSVHKKDQILWGDMDESHPLHGQYCWSGGTSMSTPLVAGCAALVRQYLIEYRGHVQEGIHPSGALMKAFLINCCRRMKGQFTDEIPDGPNNVSGFGRVDLGPVFEPEVLKNVHFSDEPTLAVQSGQNRVFGAETADSSKPLKVTLVWTDAPSLPGSGGLHNSLYLRVKHPDGRITDGDVTPYPVASNNVQQVTVPSPEPGTYEIVVHGIAIKTNSPVVEQGPDPRQDFALVVSNTTHLDL